MRSVGMLIFKEEENDFVESAISFTENLKELLSLRFRSFIVLKRSQKACFFWLEGEQDRIEKT